MRICLLANARHFLIVEPLSQCAGNDDFSRLLRISHNTSQLMCTYQHRIDSIRIPNHRNNLRQPSLHRISRLTEHSAHYQSTIHDRPLYGNCLLTMSNGPVCAGDTGGTCYDSNTVSIPQPGYYCATDTCIKCPVGTYGTNGMTCIQCRFGTWSPKAGSSSCQSSFKYSSPGLQEVYIPYGVTTIIVKLWGGGGGGDVSLNKDYVSHSGGGGGFASCNITVPMSSKLSVIIAGGGAAGGQSTNVGGIVDIQKHPTSFFLNIHKRF